MKGPRLLLGMVLLAAHAAADTAPVSATPATELTAADESRLREAARLRGQALADMEDGNYGRAAESLEKLSELLPDNILPPVNLAICFLRLDRPAEARTQIQRAQAIDPDNPQMLYTLARLLDESGDHQEDWQAVLSHFAASHPRDVRPHYLRADRALRDRQWAVAATALDEAVRRDPENLVLLVERLVASAEAGDPDATSDALDAVEDRLNGFEGSTDEYAERLRDAIDEETPEALRPPALVLRNLLRPTELYQLGLIPLTGGAQLGGPLFPQLDFDPALPKSIQGGQDIELAFDEATRDWLATPVSRAHLLSSIPRGDADQLLWLKNDELERLLVEPSGTKTLALELSPPAQGPALFQDIDQDGLSDLVTLAPDGVLRLYRGLEDGTLGPGESMISVADDRPAHDLVPLDLDHDGDLDLFAPRLGTRDLYFQNNGNGWSDETEALGLAGGDRSTTGAVSADFDDDGDLDLVTSHPDGPLVLYLNRRAGPLVEATRAWGLEDHATPQTHVETADFDNDGLFDLLSWSRSGGTYWRNRGDGFESTPLPQTPASDWRDVLLGDFDNDGDQDGLIVEHGTDKLWLLRNRRDAFEIGPVGPAPGEVERMVHGDFDGDGDLDIATQNPEGEVALWRNQGGNRNQWIRLQLEGRNDNNSKNNTQGLFTRIEVRVGDAYQAVIGNGGSNHLGLGAARQADVIRVVWTNGLAQTWLGVSANRTLVEEQVLKGSCPFLYTWNGEEFEFVTDLMWRSPLGMLLADGSPAPHQSARDYVLIPGEMLVPSGDELWLQITEELWEAVYVDEVELLAIDYPQDVELVVDEAFRPPPHPGEAPLHWLGDFLSPTAASDHEGRDVLEAIHDRDDSYVGDLPLSRYQGLTEGHWLELAFEGVPSEGPLKLVLWGWIFPTDTTINFALSQDPGRTLIPPSLEQRDRDGRWRTVEPFTGFPNGKRKAVVVDLEDSVGPDPAGSLVLRVPTNMQIYWDAAVLAIGEMEPQFRATRLGPSAADLHYRGYSRLYRSSDEGPHLFDYGHTSVGPRFRDMTGHFTRFGTVTELLERGDDRYVLMNAGDEITVHFDATGLPELPSGWRRDWVLFTDGWVKDADIHTAHSQTVAPLPYHGMAGYPDLPTHRYPDTPEHREYLETYQTRAIDDLPFREELRDPPPLDGSDPSD